MDSRPDTYEHKGQVAGLVLGVAADLTRRAAVHDDSKLQEPERACFDEYTEKLADTTYDSPEYREHLKGMQVGLDHHYSVNDHHPEHHPGGVGDMNLIQIMEMLCDWIAATRRHADGDIHRSIDQNAERFGYGEELRCMLHNTVDALLAAELP